MTEERARELADKCAHTIADFFYGICTPTISKNDFKHYIEEAILKATEEERERCVNAARNSRKIIDPGDIIERTLEQERIRCIKAIKETP